MLIGHIGGGGGVGNDSGRESSSVSIPTVYIVGTS